MTGIEFGPTPTNAFVKDYASIDLTAPPYSIKAESDITEKLQAAITALSKTTSGGWVYFPKAAEYELSGELTVPARAYTAPQQFFGFRGPLHGMGGLVGGDTNGALSINSVATTGNILGVSVNAGEKVIEEILNRPSSNVMVALHGLDFTAPSDPQIGGFDLTNAVRASLEYATIAARGNATTFTGSGYALKLPAVSNLRGALLSQVQLSGFPFLMLMTEHNYAQRLTLGQAKVAIVTEAMPNLSVLSDVLLTGVGVGIKGGGANGGAGAKFIANINYENTVTEGDRAPKAFIEDPKEVLRGKITLSIGAVGEHPQTLTNSGLPSIGGQGVHIETINAGGGDWRSKHPRDTFLRRFSNPSAAPGLTSDTFHPWKVVEGSFKITQEAANGKLQSTAASEKSAEAMLPVLARGVPRIVRSTFYPGTEKFNVIWKLGKQFDGSVHSIEVLLRNTSGTATAKLTAAGTVLKEKTGAEVPVAKGGGPYQVATKIEYNVLGQPEKVTVYIGGTELLAGTIGETERGHLVAGTEEQVPIEDGIRFVNDTESSLTLFEVA